MLSCIIMCLDVNLYMINTHRYIVSMLKYVQETANCICSINVKYVSMSVTDEQTHKINLFKLILINLFISVTSSALISMRSHCGMEGGGNVVLVRGNTRERGRSYQVGYHIDSRLTVWLSELETRSCRRSHRGRDQYWRER